MPAALIDLINIATENKPSFGEACNHCGWCCLTEVCVVGQELTGSSVIPCSLLEERDGKHYCTVAETAKNDLGIGVGCCAETQAERIAKLTVGEL